MFFRAAFDCEDGVARIAVLCAGCLSDMNDLIDTGVRRWSRVLDCVAECEFCQHEIRAEVDAL